MSKLLYIKASPRGKRSKSLTVADAFLEAYQAGHPGDGIETIDVFTAALPSFYGLAVQAKYTILHGKTHTKEEAQAWEQVEAVIDRFKSADKYVLATAMWNFNIPYKLKQVYRYTRSAGVHVQLQPGDGVSGTC